MTEKILIVDDDLETIRLVSLMLQRQGYQILTATSGTQAIAMARSEKPDLIVTDAMMPDLDGYQVTIELRKDPELADTPILMFTAKSQVDDKITGYNAGVDDYMTKPVHPAELNAHVKALLSRTRFKQPPRPPSQSGYIIGIVGCKGGLGCSTMALNLAASFSKNTKSDVIAIETKPGQGTWSAELGLANTDGLGNLLSKNPSEISPLLITQNLIGTSFGVRLLLSSYFSIGIDYNTLGEKLIAITQNAAQLSPLVILDMGTPFLPGFEKICSLCKEIYVVTEPHPNTILRTKFLFDELRTIASNSGRLINLVLLNRGRSNVQLSSTQVTDMMGGIPITMMIPPSPELAQRASTNQVPIINVQPDGLIAQQINQLTKILQAHMAGVTQS
ncbi:MAG: response regulator [Chloroflexi bacterium]|nr:response regulator [Chloroflexota bacterium]